MSPDLYLGFAIRDVETFLREACDRLKTGACYDPNCLKYGGYRPGYDQNPDEIKQFATCPLRETYGCIQDLKEELDDLEATIERLEATIKRLRKAKRLTPKAYTARDLFGKRTSLREAFYVIDLVETLQVGADQHDLDEMRSCAEMIEVAGSIRMAPQKRAKLAQLFRRYCCHVWHDRSKPELFTLREYSSLCALLKAKSWRRLKAELRKMKWRKVGWV